MAYELEKLKVEDVRSQHHVGVLPCDRGDVALWEVPESPSLVTCGRGIVLFPTHLQDCSTLHSDVPLSDLEWGFVMGTHTELNPKFSYNQPKPKFSPLIPPAAC